jgi:hypothetical protein
MLRCGAPRCRASRGSCERSATGGPSAGPGTRHNGCCATWNAGALKSIDHLGVSCRTFWPGIDPAKKHVGLKS